MPTLGSDQHLVLPGLVNSHSHGKGLGTFELGFVDDQLEMWILERKAQRQPDIYWDTLLAATRLLESGVTTVLHNHVTRNPHAYEAELDRALSAYQDAGVRLAFAPDIRWRNNFIYEPDEAFAARLPESLRQRFLSFASTLEPVKPDRYFAAFDALSSRIGLRGPKHRLLFGRSRCSGPATRRCARSRAAPTIWARDFTCTFRRVHTSASSAHACTATAWCARCTSSAPSPR